MTTGQNAFEQDNDASVGMFSIKISVSEATLKLFKLQANPNFNKSQATVYMVHHTIQGQKVSNYIEATYMIFFLNNYQII